MSGKSVSLQVASYADLRKHSLWQVPPLREKLWDMIAALPPLSYGMITHDELVSRIEASAGDELVRAEEAGWGPFDVKLGWRNSPLAVVVSQDPNGVFLDVALRLKATISNAPDTHVNVTFQIEPGCLCRTFQVRATGLEIEVGQLAARDALFSILGLILDAVADEALARVSSPSSLLEGVLRPAATPLPCPRIWVSKQAHLHFAAPDGRPNLWIKAVEVRPAAVAPGAADVLASFSVLNRGEGLLEGTSNSPGFAIGLYLEANNTRTQITGLSLRSGPLASCESASWTDLKVPLGQFFTGFAWPAGTYGLVVNAGDGNTVDESEERDNAGVGSLKIGYADLELGLAARSVHRDVTVRAERRHPRQFDLFASGEAGRWLTVGSELVLKNVGVLPSEDVSLGYYVSVDENITLDDVKLGARDFPPISPTARFWEELTVENAEWRIPDSIKPGTYYVGIWADDLDRTRETTETNNVLVRRVYIPQ